MSFFRFRGGVYLHLHFYIASYPHTKILGSEIPIVKSTGYFTVLEKPQHLPKAKIYGI